MPRRRHIDDEWFRLACVTLSRRDVIIFSSEFSVSERKIVTIFKSNLDLAFALNS